MRENIPQQPNMAMAITDSATAKGDIDPFMWHKRTFAIALRSRSTTLHKFEAMHDLICR